MKIDWFIIYLKEKILCSHYFIVYVLNGRRLKSHVRESTHYILIQSRFKNTCRHKTILV
jgi:hypothetical protein